MPDSAQFARGDKVVHTRRPEWGQGVVDHATAIVHEGRAAQRLVVVFAHYGRVTVNTALAPLLPAPAAGAVQPVGAARQESHTLPTGGGGGGWLANLSHTNPKGELWQLPDALTDPFAPLSRRLAATLDTFRYSADAHDPASQRSLLDWAIAQTGLHDPLSKYTRHDLEQAFPHYTRDRDNHLFELVRLIKRQGKPELVEQAKQHCPNPAARSALERAQRA
jgi:hypothetical protein